MPGETRSRGRFITFEGGEGAGKSTQVERLRSRLSQHGVDAVATREPGGAPRAERIRSFLLAGKAKALGPAAEAILFSAARNDHLETTIRPALARGQWVLCDRFSDSTRAYQGALGDLDQAFLTRLEEVVVGPTRPDLTFILDLPPELGLARADARRQARSEATDRFEAEDIAFHRALRAAFLAIAEEEPARCIVIDASRDAGAVAAEIWSHVEAGLLGAMLGEADDGA